MTLILKLGRLRAYNTPYSFTGYAQVSNYLLYLGALIEIRTADLTDLIHVNHPPNTLLQTTNVKGRSVTQPE
ncbi:hypothetical protein [Asticcacaulis sp.]|uniref:hypothetical protein n=1 Tax=Asticcacaulis sp. TaxID=1872648 RepID=UPI003918C428